MIMMTAKVNRKKIAIALAAAAAVIVALFLTLGGRSADPAAVTTMSDNGNRVQFLADKGWEVTTSPVESGQVRIPQEPSPVYERYNELQKSQGYDLTKYAGKTVMRYVYQVNNFPGATEPVYATLLVHKNQVIGGDITNTAAKGAVQSLTGASPTAPQETAPESTAGTE